MDAIVGYTGFVGSNLCSHHTFAGQYNSKNIKEAFGSLSAVPHSVLPLMQSGSYR